MALKFEQVYPPFLSLTYLEKHSLVETIIQRRNSFVTPKKKQKQAKSDSANKQSAKGKRQKLLSELTSEEKQELLRKIENGEI